MSSLKERLEQANAQSRNLKSRINELRHEKQHTNLGAAGEKATLMEMGGEPRVRRKLQGHFGKVYAMHWARDSVHLLSASQDGKLIVWDAVTTRKERSIPLRSSWVMTCAFDQADSQLVACGGLDNICSIYSLNDQQASATHELSRHEGYISCCRFIGNDRIITASGDSSCIYWDVVKGIPVNSFTGHSADVMFVAVSPREPSMIASGSVDESTKVWDIRSGKCVYTFDKYHTSDINCVKFFPEGYSIGTGSDDSTCRIFDIRCYGEVANFHSESISCGVTSVSFSKSGRLLFAGYDDHKCFAWDTSMPEQPIFELVGHENRVSCLDVAPNGNALCTGSWDTLLKIWA